MANQVQPDLPLTHHLPMTVNELAAFFCQPEAQVREELDNFGTMRLTIHECRALFARYPGSTYRYCGYKELVARYHQYTHDMRLFIQDRDHEAWVYFMRRTMVAAGKQLVEMLLDAPSRAWARRTHNAFYNVECETGENVGLRGSSEFQLNPDLAYYADQDDLEPSLIVEVAHGKKSDHLQELAKTYFETSKGKTKLVITVDIPRAEAGKGWEGTEIIMWQAIDRATGQGLEIRTQMTLSRHHTNPASFRMWASDFLGRFLVESDDESEADFYVDVQGRDLLYRANTNLSYRRDNDR